MHNNRYTGIEVSNSDGSSKKSTCLNNDLNLVDRTEAPKIVLLQGPVGPFFRDLQRRLESNSLNVLRVCFNAGDVLYSDKRNRINFYGNLTDWENWFRDFIVQYQPDIIIYFGSERKIHCVAKDVADEFNVKIISLEEGYIRPGFVTVEEDGNNAQSPLAGHIQPEGYVSEVESRAGPKNFHGLVSMCIFGTIYYIIRSIFSYGMQKRTYHRKIRLVAEAYCWTRNFVRRVRWQSRNLSTIQKLLEFHDKKYVLIPLQVAADGQLGRNALEWNSTRLIAASMKSFVEAASPETRLVFKIHPMERGHCNHEKLIADTAAAFGVSDRVDTISVGSLGLLTRHAAGMITINSTAGLSAIYHGTPLMVIGKALYAHRDLATCAMGKPNFELFWSHNRVADESVRRSYLSWIREQALIEGDFYAAKGMETAGVNILKHLEDLLERNCSTHEKEIVS